MSFFLQLLVNGIALGGVYALTALGYTMVYGVLGMINFAHGDVLMIGAMLSLSVLHVLQHCCPSWPIGILLSVTVVVAMVACGLIGMMMERLVYRRLQKSAKLVPIVAAIGLSILFETVAMIIWGRDYLPYPDIFSNKPMTLVSWISISEVQLVTVLITVVLMAVLIVLIKLTSLGRAMRATAENARVAGLMGIPVHRVVSITFFIGSALAAVAGVLISTNYGMVHYYMGFLPGLKAFIAAVLGGIGNIAGAVVGAVVLGVIESVGAGYIAVWTHGILSSSYQDIFSFAILILVLLIRPQGLLGNRVVDRV